MPADILRWLEHLERIERKREALNAKQKAALMVFGASLIGGGAGLDALKSLATGDPDAPEPKSPADEARDKFDPFVSEWKQLRAEFDTVPPPSECREIADSYSHAIDEAAAMSNDVVKLLDASTDNKDRAVATLQESMGRSSAIDEYGKRADAGVQLVCDHYDTKKWFVVHADFGGGEVLGSFGSFTAPSSR
jgi:hypothetical protein